MESSSQAFAPTRWTLVLRARGETPEARGALSELCEHYYQPVLQFLMREGRHEDEARELAHGFFAGVLASNGFDNANHEQGRFRSYLLGALKHFLADQRKRQSRLKRGGGTVIESLDAPSSDEENGMQVADGSIPSPEASFDRQWALAVIAAAMTRLEQEFSNNGKADQFAALKGWLIGENPSCSQASAARQLGMSEGAVKVAVFRLRKRFGEEVRAEIRQTLQDVSQVEEELSHLIHALS